jgi:hypothetical protein
MEISGLSSWLVGEQVDLVLSGFVVEDLQVVIVLIELDSCRLEIPVSTTIELFD